MGAGHSAGAVHCEQNSGCAALTSSTLYPRSTTTATPPPDAVGKPPI